jgi:hypothetical protein
MPHFKILDFILHAENVNSVQQGEVTLLSGNFTVTAAPVAVVMAKSFLLFTMYANSSSPQNGHIYGDLNAVNQITFGRANNGALDVFIRWYLIEFKAAYGINVQRGLQSMAGVTTANCALAAVNLSTSWVILSHCNNGTAIGPGTFGKGVLTAVNNMQIVLGANGGAQAQTAWQVIDYPDCTVQTVARVVPALNAVDDNAIVAVNTDKTAIFTGAWANSGSALAQDLPRVYLLNGATLRYERLAAAIAIDAHSYIVSFTKNERVVHLVDSMAAGAFTKTSALSVTVDMACSVPAGIGMQSCYCDGNTAGDPQDDYCVRGYLTGASLTAQRTNRGGLQACYYSFDVIQFC